MPTMDETEVFACEAADVAMEAIKNGVARVKYDWQAIHDITLRDIKEARDILDLLMKNDFVRKPEEKMLEEALQKAIDTVKK
jgi:malate dehydrogenase (oxaloacetate-decarboxylating)